MSATLTSRQLDRQFTDECSPMVSACYRYDYAVRALLHAGSAERMIASDTVRHAETLHAIACEAYPGQCVCHESTVAREYPAERGIHLTGLACSCAQDETLGGAK